MEAPGGIEPRTVHPELRNGLEDRFGGRSLNIEVYINLVLSSNPTELRKGGITHIPPQLSGWPAKVVPTCRG